MNLLESRGIHFATTGAKYFLVLLSIAMDATILENQSKCKGHASGSRDSVSFEMSCHNDDLFWLYCHCNSIIEIQPACLPFLLLVIYVITEVSFIVQIPMLKIACPTCEQNMHCRLGFIRFQCLVVLGVLGLY